MQCFLRILRTRRSIIEEREVRSRIPKSGKFKFESRIWRIGEWVCDPFGVYGSRIDGGDEPIWKPSTQI